MKVIKGSKFGELSDGTEVLILGGAGDSVSSGMLLVHNSVTEKIEMHLARDVVYMGKAEDIAIPTNPFEQADMV